MFVLAQAFWQTHWTDADHYLWFYKDASVLNASMLASNIENKGAPKQNIKIYKQGMKVLESTSSQSFLKKQTEYGPVFSGKHLNL